MQTGNAARLERPGDLVYPRIGPAKDGLIPQRHAVFFEPHDAGGNAGGLVVRPIESANLRYGVAFTAAGLEFEFGQAGGIDMPLANAQ